VPVVVQINKRDLPNINDVDTILNALDAERRHDHVEAVAFNGQGVFETLKLISKLTLRTLRRRMTGEEPVKVPSRRGAGEVASFRIKEDLRGTIAGGTPAPSTGLAVAEAPEMIAPEPLNVAQEIDEMMAEEEVFAPLDAAHIISEAPVPEPPPVVAEPEPIIAAPAPAPEPEIDFSQISKPAKPADVKHVKVRSQVDVMAELEALRKKATTQTAAPKPSKKEISPLDELLHPRKRELQKSLTVALSPGALGKSRSLRVAVSFEGENGVVESQEQTIELGDAGDAKSLSVNLKFES